jgi:hypothetical protein
VNITVQEKYFISNYQFFTSKKIFDYTIGKDFEGITMELYMYYKSNFRKKLSTFVFHFYFSKKIEILLAVYFRRD